MRGGVDERHLLAFGEESKPVGLDGVVYISGVLTWSVTSLFSHSHEISFSLSLFLFFFRFFFLFFEEWGVYGGECVMVSMVVSCDLQSGGACGWSGVKEKSES